MIQLSYQKRKKFPKIFRHAVTKTHYFVKWNFSHLMFLNWCQTAHTSFFSPNYTFFPIKSNKNKKFGKKIPSRSNKNSDFFKNLFLLHLKTSEPYYLVQIHSFLAYFHKIINKKEKNKTKKIPSRSNENSDFSKTYFYFYKDMKKLLYWRN